MWEGVNLDSVHVGVKLQYETIMTVRILLIYFPLADIAFYKEKNIQMVNNI